jgi:hypothetical protein
MHLIVYHPSCKHFVASKICFCIISNTVVCLFCCKIFDTLGFDDLITAFTFAECFFSNIFHQNMKSICQCDKVRGATSSSIKLGGGLATQQRRQRAVPLLLSARRVLQQRACHLIAAAAAPSATTASPASAAGSARAPSAAATAVAVALLAAAAFAVPPPPPSWAVVTQPQQQQQHQHQPQPQPMLVIAAMAPDEDTMQNVPGQLSSSNEPPPQRLSAIISGANKRAIETCTRKCVPTCVRGGEGSPGLGPLSVRREPGGVVFKDAYRSRSYCLNECANVCAALSKPPPSVGAKR